MDVERGRRQLRRRRVITGGGALLLASSVAGAMAPAFGVSAVPTFQPMRGNTAPATQETDPAQAEQDRQDAIREAMEAMEAAQAALAYVPEELTEADVVQRCAEQILAFASGVDVATFTVDPSTTELP